MNNRKIKILLTDTFNFKEKNFPSLYNYFENNKDRIEIRNAFAPHEWLVLCGKDYSAQKSHFSSHLKLLSGMDNHDKIYSFTYNGVNIFKSCKLEILQRLVFTKFWIEKNIKSNDYIIFRRAIKFNREIVLENMAVAMFWVDWWIKKIDSFPVQDFCCIFSGGFTYTKVLLGILKYKKTSPILIEHLFTGKDFYFENRKYEQIANNSDIKFNNFYNNIQVPSGMQYDKEKKYAVERIKNQKNLNVTQPDKLSEILFDNDQKIVTLLCQVLNDFSIVSRTDNINSIFLYKKIVRYVLQNTNLNILVKTHPWEAKKNGFAYTNHEINNFIKSELSLKEKNRVKLVDNYNISSIFECSDFVLTLSSQSALESILHGIKPIILCDSFFSGKGFTTDVRCVKNLKNILGNEDNGKISLAEYNMFEEFCVKLFCHHAVDFEGTYGSAIINKILFGEVINESIMHCNIIANNRIKIDKTEKLMRKLINNPYMFFKDSKSIFLRQLRFFFHKTIK